jgi:hypothetical protein
MAGKSSSGSKSGSGKGGDVNYRSAVTGQYTTEAKAKAKPNQHVAERDRPKKK